MGAAFRRPWEGRRELRAIVRAVAVLYCPWSILGGHLQAIVWQSRGA